MSREKCLLGHCNKDKMYTGSEGMLLANHRLQQYSKSAYLRLHLTDV